MPKPRPLRPKEVIDTAKQAGMDVRRKGTRVVIVDTREDSPDPGAMLSIPGHTTGELDVGTSKSVRKWFARLGITIACFLLIIFMILLFGPF